MNLPTCQVPQYLLIPFHPSVKHPPHIFKATIYAFKRQKKQKSISTAKSRRLDREGIVFTLNGQHYYDLPFAFFSRKSVKLQTIAQDIISIVVLKL